MSKEIINICISFIFFTSFSFYVITCFQWFNYKLTRVVFHFTKPIWHVFFAIIPLVLYYTTEIYFGIYLIFAYLPSLYLWHKKLDKKLVFTARVKRFFAFETIAFISYVLLYYKLHDFLKADAILPIIAGMAASNIYEKFSMMYFYKKASIKLKSIPDLKVILITASFGKTSMKNFLYEILKQNFNCYKTPRSINTLAGIIKDINENLTKQTQIYIAEAGARQKGDIAELTKLLNPEIVIIGEIGGTHIEYFKSINNTRATKLEALQSTDLKQAFLHSSTLKSDGQNIVIYDQKITDVNASLSGLNFKLDGYEFSSSILGKFQAENLAACICVAKYLGIKQESISRAVLNLKNPEHRLNIIQNPSKLIIDDSFNGNLKGMCASYELVSSYDGTKVLVTPGIVEASQEDNQKLAEVINGIFDIVIITGALNAQILLKGLTKPKVILIKDKSELNSQLAKHTKHGDLILFSNDAPSFI